MTTLLREFVELNLDDEETKNGTLTEWWLYENVPKVIYFNDSPTEKENNVEKAEDFVNYMLKQIKS